MSQSVDSRAGGAQVQSAPHTQPAAAAAAKPTNVDKMPDRNQVESRLNQIRDYIRMTSTMMESLSLSSDPRAHIQHDKLIVMVEDLRDSERKLTKLLEEYRPIVVDVEENGGGGEGSDGGENESVETILRKKMEISQRKLAELQEQQANLVCIQQQVRERLQEARQTQQALLLQDDNQQVLITTGSSSTPAYDAENSQQRQLLLANDAQVLESETTALRGKLAALQNKKKQMDLLVAELQNVEISDRRRTTSCSSSSSSAAAGNTNRDKVLELETLKQQLAHLKNLMSEATRARDIYNTINEPEINDSNAAPAADTAVNNNELFCNNDENRQQSAVVVVVDDDDDDDDNERGAIALSFSNSSSNSVDDDDDRNSEEADNICATKFNNSKERLTVEQIQAVTRELKEQQLLLQAARSEIQRLKNSTSTSTPPPPPPPPPSLSTADGGTYSIDKKFNNNNTNNNGNQKASVNRDEIATNWSSRRGSNSQHSHISSSSTPPNIWHNSTADIDYENGDNIMTAPDNLLNIGGQHVTAATASAAVDVGTAAAAAAAATTTTTTTIAAGSLEYYRQLLMSSQAQQLQMMSTTMQQCCQLLWAQQRELHAIRSSIAQIQQHLQLNQNQNQNQPHQIQRQLRGGGGGGVSNETHPRRHDNYSNLSRSTLDHHHHHLLGNVYDAAALPPSSSLPNLVSLPPTPLPLPPLAPSHPNSMVTSANSHHHHHHNYHHHQQQQQQLNNQVPPGNRANNYWDNFKSYSRQNLLSGNSKSVTDSPSSSSLTGNTLTGNSSTVAPVYTAAAAVAYVRDKRNREHGIDNISLNSLSSTETSSLSYHHSLNLQNQDHEISAAAAAATRNNNSYNDVATTQPAATTTDNNFWEDGHSSFRSIPTAAADDSNHDDDNDDDDDDDGDDDESNYLLRRHISGEIRDVVLSLLASNRTRPDYLVMILREIKAISEDHRLRPRLLRSLRAYTQQQQQQQQKQQQQQHPTTSNPLNEITAAAAADQTASKCCQSSDEDSDVRQLFNTNNNNHQSVLLNVRQQQQQQQVPNAQNMTATQPTLLVDHFEFIEAAATTAAAANTFPPSILTPDGYNEDLAEADQIGGES